ncbi:hypothetical protein ES705_19689 [subsurface metagenome]
MGMKIYTKCPYCKAEISFWSWSKDKVELKMTQSDKIVLTCKKCHKINNCIVDDFRAKESKIAILVGVIVFAIGTPVLLVTLWDYIWLTGYYRVLALLTIILIPSTIYGIINKNDQRRVKLFNQS